MRPGEPFSTSVASRITAGSTQPPVTEPAISPAPETASVAPGSRGAEPMRSITDPTAMAVPSDVQRSRMEIMSLIDRPILPLEEDSAVYYVALAAAGFTGRGSGSANAFRRD